MKLRPEVLRFARAMEKKLRANDHKKHWYWMGSQYLSVRLTQESRELRHAMKRGNADQILDEAADVANFAMMIADVARIEAEKVKP